MGTKTALVVFNGELPGEASQLFDTVITPAKQKEEASTIGHTWTALETLIEAGSIYEASALATELSKIVLPNGVRLVKAVTYKGFDLWWLNYQNLFSRFCLPYTQYKRLLLHLQNYGDVTLLNPLFGSLFSCYLRTHDVNVHVVHSERSTTRRWLPFGIVIQIFLTLFFIPFLIIQRKGVMVSTGDKFETGKDYDFRMKFVYEDLRKRKLKFVEFVRSLESSSVILQHAWKRRRPVIYTEAITYLARFLSILCGGHRRAREKFGDHVFANIENPEERFKAIVSVQYLLTSYDDILAIRIMERIIRTIGLKTAFIPATTERNFHTVLGCKLSGVPTVGILHGAASRHYNLYEFMSGFDGEKRLSVDKYGVWSEWWKEYFEKYSDMYGREQLIVSGPMRPVQNLSGNVNSVIPNRLDQETKVLFVSEVVAIPTEVIPYLDALMEASDISVYIKFRATHDSFETWLTNNRPDILEKLGHERILKGNMQEAIALCDVAVGTQSTGVIEATIQNKPFVFFYTKKWGDYFDAALFDKLYHFFAQDPALLVAYVRESRSIPSEVLCTLKERFFGDPSINGSEWVVDQIEANLLRG